MPGKGKIFLLFFLIQIFLEKKRRRVSSRKNEQAKKKSHNYSRNMHVCTVLRPKQRWSRSRQNFIIFFEDAEFSSCKFVLHSSCSCLSLNSFPANMKEFRKLLSPRIFAAKYMMARRQKETRKVYLIIFKWNKFHINICFCGKLNVSDVKWNGWIMFQRRQKWLSKYEECSQSSIQWTVDVRVSKIYLIN